MQNVLTVDLEEWFHVCGVPALGVERWDALPSRIDVTTDRVLTLCAECGITATFLAVGWVASRYPHVIERVRLAGHEIGSHGHVHARAYELGRSRFASDLDASIAALHAAGVSDVGVFRAPEWSVTPDSLWALDVLREKGFSIDASMAPLRMVGDVSGARAPHWRSTSAGSILEVPPLVADRFGQVMPIGWGWGLRMSSPRRVLSCIEAENLRGRPATLMIHPWELDPDPPRVPLPARLRFAHYFRLDGFAARLREILAGAAFGPLSAVTVAPGPS